MAGTKTTSTILLLSLALIAAGTWVGWREANPYFGAGIDDTERFVALSARAPAPGPSPASGRLILDNCLRTISSVYGRLQPTARKQAVAENCLSAADALARENPSSSYAWYVGAQMAQRLADVAGMNQRLLKSQQTGPNEQWIAELRVALAEDHLTELMPDVRDNNERDLRMLVESKRGIASIANRYVSEPEFRQRITAIVETMPEADQARFVAEVSAAARRGVGA